MSKTLHYPFPNAPSAGHVLEVAAGVLWIRMPLSAGPPHVNLWAIEDGDGWAIVDTGMHTPETIATWCQLFDGALGRHLPVTRVFVTHWHSDHVGMAGWITQRFGCRLWMPRLEFLSCQAAVALTGQDAPEYGARFYRRAGWDVAAIENYRVHFDVFGRNIHALPESFRRIRDGEDLTIGRYQWRIVVGSGHSPEHACLYCPELKLLISGDQILPRISSNLSVFPADPEADPVAGWLSSLAKFRREIPNDVLVLPGHNEPFRNLHERLDELTEGQERALDRLRGALTEPRQAIDLFDSLFARKVDSGHHGLLAMATGEAIACLNHLIARGDAVVQDDASGVARYHLPPEARLQ